MPRVPLTNMMTLRIADTFTIKGRGVVVCCVSDGSHIVRGTTLRRVPDGQLWAVAAVETYLTYQVEPRLGDKLGILLSGSTPPNIGDELELVPDSVTNTLLER